MAIPDETIIELLSWLPIEDIMRCKCVCKAWRSLIDDSCFINKHLDRSVESGKLSLLGKFGGILFHLRLSNDFKSPYPPRKLGLYHKRGRVRVNQILASCNGLLCFYSSNETANLFVLNPFTRELKKLPSLPGCGSRSRESIDWGIGFTSNTQQQYKVVRIMSSKSCCDSCFRQYRVLVHTIGSSSSNSWKRVVAEVPGRIYKRTQHQILVNGALHWQGMISAHGSSVFSMKIIGFDLGTEEFRLLPHPESDNSIHGGDCSVNVMTDLNGCLSVLRSSCYREHVEIWVMEKYGIEDSWVRKYSVSESVLADCVLGSKPLWFLKNGKILLVCGGNRVCIYDPQRETTRLQRISGCFERLIYDESLVTLKGACGLIQMGE